MKIQGEGVRDLDQCLDSSGIRPAETFPFFIILSLVASSFLVFVWLEWCGRSASGPGPCTLGTQNWGTFLADCCGDVIARGSGQEFYILWLVLSCSVLVFSCKHGAWRLLSQAETHPTDFWGSQLYVFLVAILRVFTGLRDSGQRQLGAIRLNCGVSGGLHPQFQDDSHSFLRLPRCSSVSLTWRVFILSPEGH